MMTTALATRNGAHLSVSDTMTLAETFVRSGFFADTKQAAQAVVKIMAGAELGVPPIAAMTGIHVVQGNIALSATLVAGLIKRSGVYDYRVTTHTATECVVEFYQAGKPIGVSSFTLADAKQAGLAGKDMWQKYPRPLLFARAMTAGARTYTPDVFGGPVYAPEELGAEVNPETGEVVEHDGADIIAKYEAYQDRHAVEAIAAPQAPQPETNTDADADHIVYDPAPKSWKDELGKCADGKCVLACMRWIRAVEPTGFRRSHAIAHAYKLLVNFAPDGAGLNWVYDQASIATDMATKEHHEVAEHIAAKRQLLNDEAGLDAFGDPPDDDSDLDQPDEIELMGDGTNEVPD